VSHDYQPATINRRLAFVLADEEPELALRGLAPLPLPAGYVSGGRQPAAIRPVPGRASPAPGSAWKWFLGAPGVSLASGRVRLADYWRLLTKTTF